MYYLWHRSTEDFCQPLCTSLCAVTGCHLGLHNTPPFNSHSSKHRTHCVSKSEFRTHRLSRFTPSLNNTAAPSQGILGLHTTPLQPKRHNETLAALPTSTCQTYSINVGCANITSQVVCNPFQ